MDVRLAADIVRVANQPRSSARESTNTAPAETSRAETTAVSDQAAPTAAPPTEAPRSTGSGQFYVSPFLTFDSRSLTVIFQVRDTESGDVTRQFPAESVVERYRRDPSARPFVLPEVAPSEQEQAGPPPPTIGGPVAEAANESEQADSGSSDAPTTGTAQQPGTDARGSAASTVSRPPVDLVT